MEQENPTDASRPAGKQPQIVKLIQNLFLLVVFMIMVHSLTPRRLLASTARYGEDRCGVGQSARTVPKQQQKAGSSQVLQFPRPQEAASHRGHPDRALQRHHRHGRTKIPPHLDVGRNKHSACNRHTCFLVFKLLNSLPFYCVFQ